MIPVPWRTVKSWSCVECGMCCKDYHVVLNFNEWAKIVRSYGADATISSLSKLFLGKKSDGTCCFLSHHGDVSVCGLQYMKPIACKIWPFKIFLEPKLGSQNQALYKYQDHNFFVYVDPACTGLRWGKPDQRLVYKTLPEFIDIAVGLRKQQFYSTSKVQGQPGQNPFRGRTVI